MDIIKNSMLSLALAGTLTASQFSENAKDYFPNKTLQELNTEKQNIKKSKKHIYLDSEKIQNLEKQLDIMLGVNNRTFEDLFPALEISLQQWIKDDRENVYSALKFLDDAFDVRMKQYSNLKDIYKNSNVSSVHMDKIKEMVSLTAQAKKKVKELENQVKILLEAEKVFIEMNSKVQFQLSDYWLPSILEKDNALLITINDLKNDDFDSLNQLEDELNGYLESKTIDIITLG
ncbi:MAG: hypothetical protein U9R50_09225 [Campylobacterota bacterium]|nr:hypothetical protein [Campylobacterota bacterium]